MRHFRKSILTLATTAAVLVPAGLATASDPALIDVCDGHGACSPVTITEVTNNQVCGISVLQVNALLAGSVDKFDCTNGNGKYAKKH